MTLFTNIRRFVTGQQGVAAMEFALNLPLLVMLGFGGFETSRYLLIQQKSDKVAYTVADVVAQTTSSTLTQAQLNQILTAAGKVMEPFSFRNDGYAVVTSVSKVGTNPPTVRWRYGGGGTTSRPSRIGNVNTTAALPNGLTLNDKDNVIVVEIFYNYTPALGGSVVQAQQFYRTAVFKPRLGALSTAPI